MEIIKSKNSIIIKDCVDFDIKKILECGQIFRFFKNKNCYTVISGDKIASVIEGNPTIIISKDVQYFFDFFDLNRDYKKMLAQIKQPLLKEAIQYGRGIRILKQQLLEVIVSFVISANNNIKRIQKIINNLCTQFGTNMGEFYAFPTLEQLKKITQVQYNNIGAGYRGNYLYKLSRQLDYDLLETLVKKDTQEARKELIKLAGVGPKVADCILLFGMNRFDVFPVDTWIEKVYHDIFGDELKNREQISKFLVNRFKDMSGLCQQYLFYYKRDNH